MAFLNLDTYCFMINKNFDIIPYVNPTSMLEFFNELHLSDIDNTKLSSGQTVSLQYVSLADYFVNIPREFTDDPRYAMEYHNALLKMAQLLVNEGLLSPVTESKGFYQKFMGNGFSRPDLKKYGYYDFMIYGFHAIRENFQYTVRPIIINQGSLTEPEGIGTGFTVMRNRKRYFVTARHCIPKGDLISIPQFLPKIPLIPANIYAPSDANIDLVVLELPSVNGLVIDEWFYLDKPHVLDQVLTMGYPPIQGFTEAVQIAETATISSNLKATRGEITGQGLHYWGGMKEHFLISARVKGGNSGGPVINRYGLVVGIIIEIPQSETGNDLLGYGVAISSSILNDLLLSIEGPEAYLHENPFEENENPIDYVSLPFKYNEKGFWLI